MKFVLIVLVIGSCLSCGSNPTSYGNEGVYISVENKTSDHIDSILVYARTLQNQAKKLSLGPYSKKRFYLNMNGMGNGDGSWRMEYKFRNANVKKSWSFGYYTSGHVEEDWIELKIDSNRVKETYH